MKNVGLYFKSSQFLSQSYYLGLLEFLYVLSIKFSKNKIWIYDFVSKFEKSTLFSKLNLLNQFFILDAMQVIFVDFSCCQPSVSSILLKSVYKQKKNMEA